jgi:hypothetical protein
VHASPVAVPLEGSDKVVELKRSRSEIDRVASCRARVEENRVESLECHAARLGAGLASVVVQGQLASHVT